MTAKQVDFPVADLELLLKQVKITASEDSDIYLITSVISRRNERFVVNNVETKVFVKKQDARVYMEKKAKALFFGSVLPGVDYDEKYGAHYYYNDDGNYIDFGCKDQGYRTSLVNWGFVRMERVKLLSAGVYTQHNM